MLTDEAVLEAAESVLRMARSWVAVRFGGVMGMGMGAQAPSATASGSRRSTPAVYSFANSAATASALIPTSTSRRRAAGHENPLEHGQFRWAFCFPGPLGP